MRSVRKRRIVSLRFSSCGGKKPKRLIGEGSTVAELSALLATRHGTGLARVLGVDASPFGAVPAWGATRAPAAVVADSEKTQESYP